MSSTHTPHHPPAGPWTGQPGRVAARARLAAPGSARSACARPTALAARQRAPRTPSALRCRQGPPCWAPPSRTVGLRRTVAFSAQSVADWTVPCPPRVLGPRRRPWQTPADMAGSHLLCLPGGQPLHRPSTPACPAHRGLPPQPVAWAAPAWPQAHLALEASSRTLGCSGLTTVARHPWLQPAGPPAQPRRWLVPAGWWMAVRWAAWPTGQKLWPQSHPCGGGPPHWG